MPLSAGAKLGTYDILAPIGAGGMGEVYRAMDPRLQRSIALKVLPDGMARDPERLARFQREARAVAALNHPHIVTIFSVEESGGIHFLTMELVEGQPLDRMITANGLPVRQIVDIAIALADALCAAHEKGIVHRDLKPANIMVTGEGRVKVLDFGLAKDVRSAGSDDLTRTSIHQTQAGMVMGTPAYMSPEQLSARPLDHRADIFSLGVVLYEMATGKHPFVGHSSAELISSVLRDTPPSLTGIRSDLPTGLVLIIQRCLQKDPSQRFQTARDVVKELQALANRSSGSSAAGAQDAGQSVAVMPFQSLSADPENEYFSEGLAEEILNALSQVEGLRVAARASSFYFKGKPTEMSEIASKLHVANLLQGSVRRAGNRVRVTVQLVDAANGFQLWSERYDRQMEDIFEIQDDIARSIAERLKLTLGAAAVRSTNNVEAYELYLKGRHFWHQRSPGPLKAAMECFEQVIKLDPQFALAYSGLADCYSILRFYAWMPAEQGRAPALAAVTHGMNLAPELWEMSLSRGMYKYYFERNWREAEPDFQKAIAINPRSSLAHGYYGLFLTTAGRMAEALKHAELACQLDPMSAVSQCIAGGVFFTVGNIHDAERTARRALELQPEYLFGLWIRGLVQCGLTRHKEAVETLERAVAISRAPIFVGLLGFGYARAGRTEDAMRIKQELEDRGARGEYVPASALLQIYVGLGDIPGVRRQFALAIEESTPPLQIRIASALLFDEFRVDPEIQRLHLQMFGW
jgi:serine/threonine protein kinase/Tfp pilus assembly protein PilF